MQLSKITFSLLPSTHCPWARAFCGPVCHCIAWVRFIVPTMCLLYRPVPSHGPSVMLRVCLLLVAVICLRPTAVWEKTCSLPLLIIGRPDACSTSSPTPVSLTFSPVMSSQVSSLNRTGRCGCSTPSGDLSSPTPSWQPTTFFIFPRRL
jgi:hypothetical protein